MSVQNDCLLWDSHVVVPNAGREAVLTMLHDAHPGVTRMKALARGIICLSCLSSVNQKSPPVTPLHPWEFPSCSWSCLHIEFEGPFLGKQFIVLMDAYSKWLEVTLVL